MNDGDLSKIALDKLVADRLNGRSARNFQLTVANSPGKRTLVMAGCGSGKTLAAYMRASNIGAKRLIFCYPTTHTSTEGFRDYIHESSIVGNLQHSRAKVDIKEVLSTGETGDGESEASEVQNKLNAINLLGSPAVVCTAHTILGICEWHRLGPLLFPLISKSMIVFDEIHSYDDRLFDTFVSFLKMFPGLDIVCMSASVQQSRLEKLKDLGFTILLGPKEIEEKPRYKIRKIKQNEAHPIAMDALNSGKKILWICNTVARTIQAYKNCRYENKVCYHSGFRYIDRRNKHVRLMAMFGGSQPSIAFTTQVAEMSLDISAWVLITEEAPPPALVQRLGRCNRKGEIEDGAEVYVYEPIQFSTKPYEAADIADGRLFVDQLVAQGFCSQKQLMDAVPLSNAPFRPNRTVGIFNQLFGAIPGTITEGVYNTTCIMDRDLQSIIDKTLDIIDAEIPIRSNIVAGLTVDTYKYRPVIDSSRIVYSEEVGYEGI